MRPSPQQGAPRVWVCGWGSKWGRVCSGRWGRQPLVLRMGVQEAGPTWSDGYRTGRGQRPYRAELGLQLDLQVLHGAARLRDLRPAARQGLGVGGHLVVQLLRLEGRMGPRGLRRLAEVGQGADLPDLSLPGLCRAPSPPAYPGTCRIHLALWSFVSSLDCRYCSRAGHGFYSFCACHCPGTAATQCMLTGSMRVCIQTHTYLPMPGLGESLVGSGDLDLLPRPQ